MNHGFAKLQEQWYDFQVSILRVNRQINNEASAIWRGKNVFVIIGFQANLVLPALAPSITLSPNFQMYQQVAATMTLNSTYAGALNGSLVKRLYALQDLETAIPQDLLAYQCCTIDPTRVQIHLHASEKRIDFLAFKPAIRVLSLKRVTVVLDDGTTQDYGSQDIESMAHPENLTGEALLDYLRVILAIAARLISQPDHALNDDMFFNTTTQVIHILQRPNPMEVHDPHTFWTFVVDIIFAIKSLNATPSTIDVTRFSNSASIFEITSFTSSTRQFRRVWNIGLRERYRIYEAWAVAFRALAYDDTEEESGTVSAKNSLQELLSQNLLPSHGLDLTEIKDAVDAEEFTMPPNPCWIARLTAEEIAVLEFPYEAARIPG
ncbi:MAG: hypothetical protein Q9215_000322 [Flavoplaca cf. flavocitrina]